MRKYLSLVPSTAFVLTLGAACIYSLYAGYAEIRPQLPEYKFREIATGKATLEFEHLYAEEAPGYAPSKVFWGALEYFLFNEGRSGVVVGEDGWLFSSEEFSWDKTSDENVIGNLSYIKNVKQTLDAKGIKLLVALVPEKAIVMNKYLGENRLPKNRTELYDTTISELSKSDISLADIRKTLSAQKEPFLRTDTHWTPQGAKAASLEIAQAVRKVSTGNGLPLGSKTFVSTETETVEHRGDLARYIPLGVFESAGPKPDELESFSTTEDTSNETDTQNDMSEDLFGDVSIPYVLVGTSYSADKRWNFEGFLKEALGEDILNVADSGKGPFTTMEAYLKSEPYEQSPPNMVIWEIPVRYLPINEPIKEVE